MPNTHVYTGADGAITLSVPPGNEGAAAQAALDAYELIAVGRATDVRVEVRADVRAFNEIGQRYPSELRPGNVHITGTLGRAYVNGALLQLLLGEAAASRPAASWTQPAFNITVLLENAATPGTRNTLTLHDVKIDSWIAEVPEDEFVLEQVGFKALYMTVADEQ
jgi:hypothetical protein